MTETISKDAEDNVTSAMVIYEDYKDVNGILLSQVTKMNLGELSVTFTATEILVKKKGKTDAFIGDFSK